MAIEYKDQMPESDSMPMEHDMETESETTSIPSSMLGGKTVSPGDVIRLEVVEVDSEDGMIEVKYAMPKEKMDMSIEAMASKFRNKKGM